MVEVKFCGLTRPEDAAEAGRLGASYVGTILAGGPRHLDPARARLVHAAAPAGVRRVGVFGAEASARIAAVAADAGLDVIQLHGDQDADDVHSVRRCFDGAIWVVARVSGDTLPARVAELFEGADAVVLDARVEGALGGTGVQLPWERLRDQVDTVRAGRVARLVLAGGLRPSNVAAAIAALGPDVVDVSSGVESAPGIKDHELMRAFAAAAGRAAGVT